MIFEVRQTNSGFNNNTFQIIEGDQLRFTASAHFEGIIGKMLMYNPAGEKLFETSYDLLENISESAIPYKFLFTGQQKFGQYKIMNNFDQQLGCFYSEKNGLLAKKTILECGGTVMEAYRRSIGTKEVISLYINDAQIGQISRSNITVNNRDCYLLHILPGYESWMMLLSFFVIYFDFRYHNNNGEVVIGKKVQMVYTYDKNNDKYDPDFVRLHFGQEEEDRINGSGPGSIRPEGNGMGMSMKTFWIIFGVGWGVALLAAAIILLVIFL